jgi:2-C-methyl-D-erythritol 4-phosphate cytidylyltransferase
VAHDVDGPVWTIVVGAGSGARFGGPKQYEVIGDARVIDHSVAVARSVSDGVVVVVPAADAEREGGVAGGATRRASVRAGLDAVPGDAAVICVHDAARPFASADLYRAVIAAVRAGAAGAVPGVAVVDTVKVTTTSSDGTVRVASTPDRSTLVAVQTPQAFAASALRHVHEVPADGASATDDAMMLEAAGAEIVVVPGEVDNRKITTPDDLAWARAVVAR